MREAMQAQLACYSCRQRKVRCDGALPHCSQCQRGQKACKYPEDAKKPGPKMGSIHKKHRKRDPTTLIRGSHKVRQQGDVESIFASPEPALKATRHQRTENIQSISYIIHPSHESCSPQSSRLDVAPADTTNGNGSLLISACCTFGVTWETMENM